MPQHNEELYNHDPTHSITFNLRLQIYYIFLTYASKKRKIAHKKEKSPEVDDFSLFEIV